MFSEVFKTLAKAKFRVKIRSLADEARAIKREERRVRAWASRRGVCASWCAAPLQQHRREDVREESRAALLARAYYLGIPYHVPERVGKTPVPYRRVASILKSLTG